MLFNLILEGVSGPRLTALDDTLRPLIWGLREAGHRVIAFGRRFESEGAINLIVDDGEPVDARAHMARARAEAGAGVCVGLLCPDDIGGLAINAPRRAALLRAVEAARFVWTCAPAPLFDPSIADGRAALVGFGFHPALSGQDAVPEARREVGMVLYGEETPYRAALAERLTQVVPRSLYVRPGHFPDYIVTDLLRRATAVIVTRGAVEETSVPTARILKAVCNGTAVIAEAEGLDASSLAAYATPCPFGEIAARAQAAAASGGYAEAGGRVLSRLRADTSMAAGLTAALAVATRAAGG